MLRITVDRKLNGIVLLLEGKLIGAWVGELRSVWAGFRSAAWNEKLVVSLTEVSSIDLAGRHLLTEIHSAGGVLAGSGLFAKALIEDITGSQS
jgi:hypothetical protein